MLAGSSVWRKGGSSTSVITRAPLLNKDPPVHLHPAATSVPCPSQHCSRLLQAQMTADSSWQSPWHYNRPEFTVLCLLFFPSFWCFSQSPFFWSALLIFHLCLCSPPNTFFLALWFFQCISFLATYLIHVWVHSHHVYLYLLHYFSIFLHSFPLPNPSFFLYCSFWLSISQCHTELSHS